MSQKKTRISPLLLVLSFTCLALLLLTGSYLLAGNLEPPGDSVDGAGAPKATGATYPAWDKILRADDTGDPCNSSRFTCVMGGAAVRDNETGLVWERSPLTTTYTWHSARNECTRRVVGRRIGWRSPSVHEQASLVDPAVAPGPALPPGHPFQKFESALYWSATRTADTSIGGITFAWGVDFDSGLVFNPDKSLTFPVWCVRGAMNADQY